VGVKPDAAGFVGRERRARRGGSSGARPMFHRRRVRRPRVPLPRERRPHLSRCGTGAQIYSDRAYAQTYRASPVAADGRIYLTAKDGTFTVVQAGAELKILARNKLPDQFTASPAISNGRIYLRGFGALYASVPRFAKRKVSGGSFRQSD